MKSDLKRLHDIFKKMSEAGFDSSKKLKWTFYFFDTNKDHLLDLVTKLKVDGYSIENLILMEDDFWRLSMIIEEVLSPEQLHERNLFFNKIADEAYVDLYDGWDVAKIVSNN